MSPPSSAQRDTPGKALSSGQQLVEVQGGESAASKRVGSSVDS
jgi:hypothetical protein